MKEAGLNGPGLLKKSLLLFLSHTFKMEGRQEKTARGSFPYFSTQKSDLGLFSVHRLNIQRFSCGGGGADFARECCARSVQPPRGTPHALGQALEPSFGLHNVETLNHGLACRNVLFIVPGAPHLRAAVSTSLSYIKS